MLQPAFSDCLCFDLLSHFQDICAAAVVDIGGGQVVQAFVVAMVVVVIDEGADLAFQVAGQEVVFQENPVLHRLVPAFDLALGLRMVRRTANMVHAEPSEMQEDLTIILNAVDLEISSEM